MTYTIDNLIKSIAAQIAGAVPGYPIYDSPNQQGTEFPCFFVFLMPSDNADEIGREKRNIWFDVVFVQERNIPGANEQINQIADTLDYLFDSVIYTDGTDTVPLHTHERSYSIEDQELHYKFRISQRVFYDTQKNPMRLLSDLTINHNPQYDGLGTITGHPYLGMVAQRTAIRTVGG